MMSVNSDSKLFICSDCFSISFSSLETLSVLGEVGALFWGGSLWLFGVFRVPCSGGALEVAGVGCWVGLGVCLVGGIGVKVNFGELGNLPLLF